MFEPAGPNVYWPSRPHRLRHVGWASDAVKTSKRWPRMRCSAYMTGRLAGVGEASQVSVSSLCSVFWPSSRPANPAPGAVE